MCKCMCMKWPGVYLNLAFKSLLASHKCYVRVHMYLLTVIHFNEWKLQTICNRNKMHATVFDFYSYKYEKSCLQNTYEKRHNINDMCSTTVCCFCICANSIPCTLYRTLHTAYTKFNLLKICDHFCIAPKTSSSSLPSPLSFLSSSFPSHLHLFKTNFISIAFGIVCIKHTNNKI